jgi:hypothetical protein
MLPTDRVFTSPALRIATPEENEYEIRSCHPSGHDVDGHNRRNCAGWVWAWWSEVAGHHHATACADDGIADGASAEAPANQATINVDDGIAAPLSLAWSPNGSAVFGEEGVERGRVDVVAREEQLRGRIGVASTN